MRLPLTPSRVLALLGTDDPPPSREAARCRSAAPVAGGLALQASGTVDIAATPERVFAVLLDPQALARVIPGCHALDADRAESLPRRRDGGRRHDQGALRGARSRCPTSTRRTACGSRGQGLSSLGTGARRRARAARSHADKARGCTTTTRRRSAARSRWSAAACSRAPRRSSLRSSSSRSVARHAGEAAGRATRRRPLGRAAGCALFGSRS